MANANGRFNDHNTPNNRKSVTSINSNSSFSITEVRSPKLFALEINNIVDSCTKQKLVTPFAPPRPSKSKLPKRTFPSPELLEEENPSKRHGINMDETRIMSMINGAVDKAISPVMAKLSMLDNIVSKMDNINAKLDEVNTKVTALENDLQFYSIKYDEVVNEIKDLKSKVDETIFPEVEKLNDQLMKSEKTILDLQCRSMRDNILIFNLPEKSNQPSTENSQQKTEREDGIKIAKEFFVDQLKIDDEIVIQRAHRIGRVQSGNIRPLVVKFLSSTQRELVLRSSINLKDTPFAIAEQFPPEIVKRRKILLTIKKELANKKTKSSLSVDKLYVSGQVFKDSRIYW
jgi:uncharacterized protein YoxC